MGPQAGRALALVLLLAAAAAAAAPARAANVTFPAPDPSGRRLTLTAELARPEGGGPFAAVILLHGCSGPRGWTAMWSERLAGWGYAVLVPDSFAPRGIRRCEAGAATVDVRAGDARAASRYLAGLPFVDPARVALLGMSHGATAALIAAGETGFAAVVALYPRCYQAEAEGFRAPVLILIGDADHLAPAGSCATLGTKGGSGYPVRVKVYPGATHAFDWEGLDMLYFGQHIHYDAAAAADAVPRIRGFLDLYLKK